MSTTSKKALRIGVMLESCQLSDIIGIDILGNLSEGYVQAVGSLDRTIGALAHHAMPIEFFYLATTLSPATLTPGGANLSYNPTHTYDTCPRDLDIILIGGPMPSHRPASADTFMKEAWLQTRVWMTTCVGAVWIASAGLLEGKRVTTNRGFLGLAREWYPGVVWEDKRWIVEAKEWEGEKAGGKKGELWTSGGAGAGIDMIATYALENFDREFVRVLALEAMEFQLERERGEEYGTVGFLEGLEVKK